MPKCDKEGHWYLLFRFPRPKNLTWVFFWWLGYQYVFVSLTAILFGVNLNCSLHVAWGVAGSAEMHVNIIFCHCTL